MARRATSRIGGIVGAERDSGALEPAGAEAVARRFARAMLAKDPRAAAACLSTGARILTADGTEVSGSDNVLAVLHQITSSEQSLEIRLGRTIVSDGVASSTQFWRRIGRDPTSGGYEGTTAARLVLARLDGRWRIVIANPWE
jgi:ketosteroid isomerase-like protein